MNPIGRLHHRSETIECNGSRGTIARDETRTSNRRERFNI